MLLVLVVHFAVGHVCDVHHCGDTEDRRSVGTHGTAFTVPHNGSVQGAATGPGVPSHSPTFCCCCCCAQHFTNFCCCSLQNAFLLVFLTAARLQKLIPDSGFSPFAGAAEKSHFSSTPLIIRPKNKVAAAAAAAAKPVSSGSVCQVESQGIF